MDEGCGLLGMGGRSSLVIKMVIKVTVVPHGDGRVMDITRYLTPLQTCSAKKWLSGWTGSGKSQDYYQCAAPKINVPMSSPESATLS